MTLHSFVGRLTQLLSRLYYQHQWEEWELLAIAGAALVPLLLIARQQRKERAARARARHDRERLPIIGVKLADGTHSKRENADPKKVRLTGARNGQDDATKQADSSNEQIRQLQCEIARRRQVEARLEQQFAELTATNEKLQYQISEIKQAEERLQQQTIKLPGANKKLQKGFAGPKGFKEFPERQADSAPTAGKHPAESRRSSEPLDIEKLKAIAALARQIQQRPRA